MPEVIDRLDVRLHPPMDHQRPSIVPNLLAESLLHDLERNVVPLRVGSA
jgi:hypothetical protein